MPAHARASSGRSEMAYGAAFWIPAFAGMTVRNPSASEPRPAWEKKGGFLSQACNPAPAVARRRHGCDPKPQRMPASISLVSASIVFGVTTPAPVLSDRPGILYLAVITHCTTGMKPCR